MEFLYDNGKRSALLHVGDHRYRPLKVYGKREYIIFTLTFEAETKIGKLFIYEPVAKDGTLAVNAWNINHHSPRDNDITYIMWANGTLEKRKK